jgi:hypothetical protein
MNTAIALVPNTTSIAKRVATLQAEAKSLAKDHVQNLITAIAAVEHTAAEIALGGDAYPAGVRDIARRMTEDCEARMQTLAAIVSRAA